MSASRPPREAASMDLPIPPLVDSMQNLIIVGAPKVKTSGGPKAKPLQV